MKFLRDVLSLYQERSAFFIRLTMEHIYLSFIAIVFIAVIGITIGITIAKYQKLAEPVLSVVNFIYTIPSIALFGILVAITGIGNRSALIALVVYGMLPMIRNTYVAIAEIDDLIIESAIGMGTTGKQLLLRIQLPLALPVIIAGFRIMVVMTIALGGIASFIGAGGLGVAIWRGITTSFPEMTVAGSLLVALLAIVVDLILGIIEKVVRKKVLGTVKS
ncbi:ABC transporter permease [Isachenkonia alkalipeptolytica]|uniref:ABC transporter permease n=1 Tax=Isachenkonia alkalipeptolytica TaxID=2565777 RepID=UPI00191C2B83|nr:ABC transporter permease [Isachenkonia alkalipeptolytica]